MRRSTSGNDVGVDEVITRKFLTWDDNTHIEMGHALDPHLYRSLPTQKKEPCVWPFERLNVDTLGRIALCGQDISFRTAELFPNANDVSIKEIWQGERFNWYRRMHLEGRGAEAFPCRGCSAWFAGIRDWDHGWLKVLKKSGDHLKEVMRKDLGVEVADLRARRAVADAMAERRDAWFPLDRPHLDADARVGQRSRADAADGPAAAGLGGRSTRRGSRRCRGAPTAPTSRLKRWMDASHVGNVWLWDIDRRHRKAELRVVVGDRRARGKALGAEAIDRLCRHGFDQLGFAPRSTPTCSTINPPARTAFERAGFALEGTLARRSVGGGSLHRQLPAGAELNVA